MSCPCQAITPYDNTTTPHYLIDKHPFYPIKAMFQQKVFSLFLSDVFFADVVVNVHRLYKKRVRDSTRRMDFHPATPS